MAHRTNFCCGIGKNIKFAPQNLFQASKFTIFKDIKNYLMLLYGIHGIMLYKFTDFKNDLKKRLDSKTCKFIKTLAPVKKVLGLIILLENGQVFELSSDEPKIRCLSLIENCVDITIEDKDILLAICKETNILVLKTFQRNNNSFEHINNFECGPLSTDQFTITIQSVKLTVKNLYLFEKLLGIAEIEGEKQARLFTVESSAFFIFSNSGEVSQIMQFSSNILKIWFSDKLKVIIVLTVMSSIELLYYCHDLKMMKSKTLFLGDDVNGFDFFNEDTFFISTNNEMRIVKILRNHDTFTLSKKAIEVIGINDCVYVPNLNLIFVLTENNLIYKTQLHLHEENTKQLYYNADNYFLNQTSRLEQLLYSEVKLNQCILNKKNNYEFVSKVLEAYKNKTLLDKSSLKISYFTNPNKNEEHDIHFQLNSDMKNANFFTKISFDIDLPDQSESYVLVNVVQFQDVSKLIFKFNKNSSKNFTIITSQNRLLSIPVLNISFVVVLENNLALLNFNNIKTTPPSPGTLVQHTQNVLLPNEARQLFTSIIRIPLNCIIDEVITDMNMTMKDGCCSGKYLVFNSVIIATMIQNKFIEFQSYDLSAMNWFRLYICELFFDDINNHKFKFDHNWRTLKTFKRNISGFKISNKFMETYIKLRSSPIGFLNFE